MISTPFGNSLRSPEGIKVFHNKKIYNPITDEYTDIISNNNNNNTTNSTTQNSFNNNNQTNNNEINNSNQNSNNINNTNNNSNTENLEQLRNLLMSRGSKSIFTFQRMLSIYDRNHSGQISLDDFITIFQTYNLNFTVPEIQKIFQIFDINQTGMINYDILLSNLIGQMNERRLAIVKKVFDSFNKNENGEVLMNEIKQKFNSSRHPDVVKEKKNKEEIYGEFLDKLEIFREYNDNLKSSYSNTMSFNDFVMFYNEISMNIKDDNLFEYLMNNCWDLDKLSFNNINNNSNWNNNCNNNYNRNNNNYDRNIRARTGKQIMNLNNRPY
jgi:Ca2+-binding EF-hand superfamily protein